MAVVHYVHESLSAIDLGDHVFPTEKYEILARLVREELRIDPLRIHPWDDVHPEDLERVHTPRYVEDLRLARRTWSTLRSELPVDPDVIKGFAHMVGGSIATVRLAAEHGVAMHLGGGFHHAFPDHAEGFCYLHDMAIAVERQRAETGLGRVLFVDVDVHQGNGTAVVYADDRETFTYSIHQTNNYPLKQRSDFDHGLDDGVGDEEYLELLARDLDALDERFPDPELVCYVAGVDAHADDALGGLGMTAEGLDRRDRMVLERYVGRGTAVAVFLAGGYAPSAETTARLHLQTVRAAEQAAERSRV